MFRASGRLIRLQQVAVLLKKRSWFRPASTVKGSLTRKSHRRADDLLLRVRLAKELDVLRSEDAVGCQLGFAQFEQLPIVQTVWLLLPLLDDGLEVHLSGESQHRRPRCQLAQFCSECSWLFRGLFADRSFRTKAV